MLFPTFAFAFFFLCVFIGYWYVFRRNLERRIFLVAASYLFYAFWDWRFCFLLLFSTAANYGFSLLVGTNREHLWRKTWLVLSVIFNLLVLGFFKYYNFFAESANSLVSFILSSSAHTTTPSFIFPALAIIMPVGISFYTFKVMSYVFDVYLCEIPPVRSFLDVTLYVSFFPQIASGPIVHAANFFPQLQETLGAGTDINSKPVEFDRAVTLIMSGLVKKMIFANFLSTLFVDPVFSDPSRYHAIEVALAAIGYSVVIYSDFSGYSDMAIGIALLLGFRTPANFNRPYMSFSVTEFWKRWHITFSSWLRDYLYFSMGGSRFGKFRTLVALFFTMLLGGLWHGASVTFLVWGAMQGLFLAIDRGFGYGTRRSSNPFAASLQIGFTFLFTTLSWIVFRSASLQDIQKFLLSLGNSAVKITLVTPVVLVLIVSGILVHAVPERVRSGLFDFWKILPSVAKGILIALFFGLLSVVSMSAVAPFIYFQF
jgi:D-alanyl-lipoteichoic acid acyltransferase DltB (MBOAT superfamily)